METDPPALDLHQALALHQQGRLADAEQLYAAIAQHQPDNADVRHLLGTIALQTGRADQAVAWFDEAIRRDANLADAYNNRAIALRRLGRAAAALDDLECAVALEPGNAEAHNNRGSVLRDLARLEDALAAFDRAIALQPAYAAAHINRGMLLRAAGHCEAALASYDQALALQPNHAPLHFNRGNVLLDLGQCDAAVASYDTAIRLMPQHAEAHAARGNALLKLGRAEAALASYDQALALRPAFAGAHSDRGNALRHLQRPDEALASYDRAIALQPQFAAAWFSRGELLHVHGRTGEAVESFQRVVAIDPLHGPARLAACMAELPILYRTEAEIAVRRDRYMAALAQLDAAVADPAIGAAVAAAIGRPPFYLPYQGQNDVVPQARYGGMACRLLAEHVPPPQPMQDMPRARVGERIRIGIVSAFFRAHTVWKLFLEGWLQELDRDRFAVFGFHTSAASDAETARAVGLCDGFVQGPLAPAAWRHAIAGVAPHVLLFPDIGMDNVAGALAAQRFAPVQCVSWGHPVTTGMPTLDYFLSSELMEPPDAAAHYTEQLVRLPNLALHYTPDADPPVAAHAAFDLDPAQPVFWSGQTQFKYLPQYDWIFPRIAQLVGRCQFVFVSSVSAPLTEAFRQRLAAAFTAAGLQMERYCRIFPRLPHAQYVALAGLADVILDPPGWSGGKSTLDCLAWNPAIVTWLGPFMRGRHTAAILHRIGCPDTVAGSLDDYVAMAVRLVQDTGWRAQVRQHVAHGKHRAFRDEAYVRALEQFLAEAVRQC